MEIDRNGSRRALRLALALFAAVVMLTGLTASPARAASAEAWGNNYFGQLGNGTSNNTPPYYGISTPVAVSGMSSGVTAIAAGGDHSIAVHNGVVYAWGDNQIGQLGNGTTTDSQIPAAVSGLSNGVTAIAAGRNHSLAVRNGRVYAWGYGGYGQLGNGTLTDSHVPVAVSGLSSGVTAIAGGSYHSLAVWNRGVYAWGSNGNGELGNGTTAYSDVPVAVSGLSSGVTAIAAGESHSLAVQNGGVYAWGYNGYGELGNGTTNYSTETPVAASGLSSGVTAIAGGGYHSLAVQNGGVYAWGYNNYGELGDGTTTNDSTPERIDAAQLTNIVTVAASEFSSYALSSDGSLWVWGDNSYGELGLGSTTDYFTPQHLLPPSGYVFTSIDANSVGNHAVATLAAAPVPEPAGLSLLAMRSLTLLRRRRR